MYALFFFFLAERLQLNPTYKYYNHSQPKNKIMHPFLFSPPHIPSFLLFYSSLHKRLVFHGSGGYLFADDVTDMDIAFTSQFNSLTFTSPRFTLCLQYLLPCEDSILLEQMNLHHII